MSSDNESDSIVVVRKSVAVAAGAKRRRCSRPPRVNAAPHSLLPILVYVLVSSAEKSPPLPLAPQHRGAADELYGVEGSRFFVAIAFIHWRLRSPSDPESKEQAAWHRLAKSERRVEALGFCDYVVDRLHPLRGAPPPLHDGLDRGRLIMELRAHSSRLPFVDGQSFDELTESRWGPLSLP